MKKFLVVASHLPESKLFKHSYTPADNEMLEYGETHFPAVPLINAHTEEGDAIRIISVTYDIPNCHKNLKLLESEIAQVCKDKNAAYEIESIVVPFDDSIMAILNVYQQLIRRFENGDELYADITYGSKPMPIVLTMALQYAYRTLKNVTIECVVYGQIKHHEEAKDATIYDVTALIQLDEIVRLMADREVSDPADIIDRIIGE